MCGIAGFTFEDKTLAKQMLQIIEHRGPDDYGVYTDSREDISVSLGNRRLSIVDLSKKGHQPMTNQRGDLVITYNGEVFNHQEIRKELEQKGYRFKSNTDTEVILNAYDAYGIECLQRLNGQFAFVIYDQKKKLLVGARDRLGIKPFYYFQNSKHLIFCSETKGILAHKQEQIARKQNINLESLNKFFALRYIPTEETIFKNIKRLLPAHYFIYDLKSRRFTTHPYWDLHFTIQNLPERYFAEQLRERLKEAVRKQLMSDVPLGVYLSGGLDSSSVVSLMSNFSDNIKTFSIGFGYGEETDEVKYAKEISQYFNTDHKEFTLKSDIMKELPKIIWHLDQPVADPAAIPEYFLSQQAKKYATVVLSGQGGDELFAGYEQNKFLLQRNKLKWVPRFVRKKTAGMIQVMPKSILSTFFRYADAIGKEGRKRCASYLTHIDDKAKAYLEIMSIFNNEERKELFTNQTYSKIKTFDLAERMNKEYFSNSLGHLNQILRYEIKEPLPENLLAKGDHTTMAWSIEERVPLLDHEIAEFAATIPPSLKLKGCNEKYILRKAMHSALPTDILKRKKHRFYVPIDHWIKEEGMHRVVDLFLDRQTIKKQGYFDYAVIEKIKRNYSQSRLFYARQLWALITFQLWHRIYIEESLNKKGRILL